MDSSVFILYRLPQISPTVPAIGVHNEENLIQLAQCSSISATIQALNNTRGPG